MSLRNEPSAKAFNTCVKCHGDPFWRTIHLLEFRDHEAKVAHLKQEFPNDKTGFIDSELRWQSFIIRHYNDKVDEEGRNLPVSMAFRKSRGV